MSSFSSLILAVACAALLLVSCEAHRDRNDQKRIGAGPKASSSLKLGYCDDNALYKLVVSCPDRYIPGPQNTVDTPNLCQAYGLTPACTELIFTNNDGGPAPNLYPSRGYDPTSEVTMTCVGAYGCPSGVTERCVQKCV